MKEKVENVCKGVNILINISKIKLSWEKVFYETTFPKNTLLKD